MKKDHIELPSQIGVVVAGHTESHESRVVSLYGDPEGLRSLGRLLIAIADLDQSKFKDGSYMDSYGYHLHLLPSHDIHPQSLEIVIGRLDPITGTNLPEWFKPTKMKAKRSIRASLPKKAEPGGPANAAKLHR